MNRRLKLIVQQLRIIKYLLVADLSNQAPKPLFDCCVCGAKNVEMLPVPAHYLGEWQKHQTIHNPFFLETMHLEHYLCSRCFCTDRDRLYALYLNNHYTLKNDTEIKLIDIAPSYALRNFIKSKKNIRYRSMDLMREDVDDRLDITDMCSYNNEQFDFFICSHVLEHVSNDKKAIQELFRITKKGGEGIIMVPINLQLENTLENPACTDIDYRWKYFFQDDHIRMYAKNDFLKRLTNEGFEVKQLGQQYFSSTMFSKNAIFPTSVLYVVKK